jgi:hypothetical protein
LKEKLPVMIDVFQRRTVVVEGGIQRESVGNNPEPTARGYIVATVAN